MSSLRSRSRSKSRTGLSRKTSDPTSSSKVRDGSPLSDKVAPSDAKDDNVFLFIPNIIGYLRVILACIAFYLLPHPSPYYWYAMGFYACSCLLDAVDGHAARYFNQATRFGAVLDMVTDRSTTTCLLVYLSIQHPQWMLLFQLLISLDLSSHYMQMYSSLSLGLASHKAVSKNTSNVLLYLYYTNPTTLFLVCAGNELFFMTSYLLTRCCPDSFFVPYPLWGREKTTLVILAALCFPICLFKQVVNVIQLVNASQSLANADLKMRHPKSKE